MKKSTTKRRRTKTKIERFLLMLFNSPCIIGQRRIRKYAGLSLQGAWRKASVEDFQEVMNEIQFPHVYDNSGRTCWCGVTTKARRLRLYPRPPFELMQLWKRFERSAKKTERRKS